MCTRAKWGVVAKAAASGARVPLAEHFVLLYLKRRDNIRL